MDVLLFQTNDEGNILIENGDVVLSSGLETAAYLSLFGGNEEDDGRPDNPLTYWGNLDETDPAKQYRSETQYLLHALPATSGNLLKVEAAAGRDLAWMIENGAASAVTVIAALVGLNRVSIKISIIAEGLETEFEFVQNWKAEV